MRTYVQDPHLLHPHFVGRLEERRRLSQWFADGVSSVFVIDAHGGTGKSALAWVWLQLDVLARHIDVACSPAAIDVERPKGIFWWSFYPSGSKFRDFVVALDAFFTGEEASGSFDARLHRVLERLLEERYLVVLDGIERILAAYQRIDAAYQTDDIEDWARALNERKFDVFTDSWAQSFFQSLASRGARAKVLLTTRLVPAEFQVPSHPGELLAGIARMQLTGLDLASSVQFFRRHGFPCHDGDVRTVGEALGYHPLFLRLIAGMAASLPPPRRGDLANVVTFRPERDLRARQHHVLEQAFETLSPDAKRLLCRISAFRIAVSFEFVASLSPFPDDEDRLIAALAELELRGLLQTDSVTYDLHPIVRSYAYARISAPERRQTHEVAATVLLERSPGRALGSILTAGLAQRAVDARAVVADHFTGAVRGHVEDAVAQQVGAVLELFHQLLGANRLIEALLLYRERLSTLLFFKFAAYYEVVPMLEELRRRASEHGSGWNDAEHAWTLNALGMCYSRMGMSDRAMQRYDDALSLSRSAGLAGSEAIILQNLSEDLLCLGRLRECEEKILESRRIAEREGDEVCAALSYRLRGYLLNITGRDGGDDELRAALAVFQARGMVHPELYVHTNMAWGAILRNDPVGAAGRLDAAERLSHELGYRRDMARIALLRAKASRLLGDSDMAVHQVREALAICRQIGLIEFEALILGELAIGQVQDPFTPPEVPLAGLREALAISRRAGFRLQEADAHMALAQLALARRVSFDGSLEGVTTTSDGWQETFEREVRHTVSLATCDGGDHTYFWALTSIRSLVAASASAKPPRKTPSHPRRARATSGDGETSSLIHLSDLHFGTLDDARRHLVQVETDLRRELLIRKLAFIVISGDVATRASADEYDAAAWFVEKLATRFDIPGERIIVAPGNHDVDWLASERAYAGTENGDQPIPHPELYLKRFESFDRNFYQRVRGEPYPLAYDDQGVTLAFEREKILFVVLNSAWECDHLNPRRAGIRHGAIATALDGMRAASEDGWLRVGVWHHPVVGDEAIPDEFLQLLAVQGVHVGIFGHSHEAKRTAYVYDQRRRIHLIGAGTFGASTHHQVPGIPWQYNVMQIEWRRRRVTIQSRRREKEMGAWAADARWGDLRRPVAKYRFDY